VARVGGVGLENVRQRLEQMYGNDSSMHTAMNTRGNYEVSFMLPLIFPVAGQNYKLSASTHEN
jgi:sensor histidine kinase YesM